MTIRTSRMKHGSARTSAAWALLLLLAAGTARVQAQETRSSENEWNPAEETVVLFNPNFEGSEALARFYAEKRRIPADHIIGLPCSVEETISRTEFEDTLRAPFLKKVIEKKWWEMEMRDLLDPSGKRYGQAPTVIRSKLKVLVLMRGIPLRVSRAAADPKPTEVDEASVDSELAAMGLLQRPIKGALENRYYQSTRRFQDAYDARGQLIVGRLDAADDATVRRMIEDTLLAEKEGLWGRAVLDFSLMDGGYEDGEKWLGRCAAIYRDQGIPVFAERTKAILPAAWPLPDTILYFGWYTDRCKGAFASPDFRFKPGAIACHLHSFSASVLRTKQEGWVGPLLDHGAAAALGNVWEPFLALTVHFDLLNARLLDGFTLGEAAWSATPGVSWMNILVGDPLYRPFPKNRVQLSQDPADLDYATYRDLVIRYLSHDQKKFHRELLRVAEEKPSPRLLELAGLLSCMESNASQAGDFFQHAAALYRHDEDQLRCALYESEISNRTGNKEYSLALLKRITSETSFNTVPAYTAAVAMEGELSK